MLVLVSLLIAVPVAYYFMHHWLQDYQYRADLSWWIFAAAVVRLLLITLINGEFPGNKSGNCKSCKKFKNGMICRCTLYGEHGK